MIALPFLLIIIVVVIAFFIKQKTFFSGKWLNNRRIKLLLAAYLIVLLLSIPVFYLLPVEGSDYRLIDSEEMKRVDDDFHQIHQKIYDPQLKGKEELNRMEGVRLNESWTFSFHEHQLDIYVVDEDYLEYSIMVERTDETDTLEILYYTSHHVMDGIDVSGQLKSPQLELGQQGLTIQQPELYRLQLTRFTKEFTITQFIGAEEGQYGRRHSGFYMGPQILLIRLPQDIHVGTVNTHIEYLGQRPLHN